VRALARVKPGSAVIHLLNYDYDSARDDVQPIAKVRVQADLGKLGVPGAQTCRFVTLDGEPVALKVEGGVVEVPQLGLWGILVL
jgi:hypothetical protein